MGEVPVAVELHFRLEIEDGWPPVSTEGLPCTIVSDGYRIERPPLFIKGLSCGDVITVSRDTEDAVTAWNHLCKSGRTTIWLLRMKMTDAIAPVLHQLQLLDCATVSLPKYGCYPIDVPAERAIEAVDNCLGKLDPDRVAIAYPSFRHDD